MNLPSEDGVANFMKRVLPSQLAHTLSRWKNILFSLGFYTASKKWPGAIKQWIKKNIQKELGDQYEEKHFDPAYNPWDQRLCLIPDSDLFDAMKSGKVEVVTDTIDRFTSKGILLNSGGELEADIIVTATGLNVQIFGGMKVKVNEELIHTGDLHSYRGVLFSGVPNFAIAVGYTNATWTLKCDLNCRYVSKILNYMEKNGYKVCTPRFDSSAFETEPLLDFDAGYIQRALDILPKQGSKAPWKVYQNYIKDTFSLKYGKVNDQYLEYK
jgi:cation diffusion facilitator CzcD-associated flavoprotein CzcO